jgi:formiminotetrahydrofolate cyclodeaminase
MLDMGKFEIESALASLSLKHFMDRINQERPEITGGCVLLTNSSLSTAMISMALKISHKRNKEIVIRRFLRQRIKSMTALQANLFMAAESDLKIFNEYRTALKSKSKDRPSKLISNLKMATRSLLEAATILDNAIEETRASLAYTDLTVASDVEAGLAVLEGAFKGIQIMIDSNRRIMESHSH